MSGAGTKPRGSCLKAPATAAQRRRPHAQEAGIGALSSWTLIIGKPRKCVCRAGNFLRLMNSSNPCLELGFQVG